jgi:hypothetical protein
LSEESSPSGTVQRVEEKIKKLTSSVQKMQVNGAISPHFHAASGSADQF